MVLAEGDIDELIEFWTLLDEDRELLVGRRGPSALGFALLLRHYSRAGRFPRGRADLSDTVLEFVAGHAVGGSMRSVRELSQQFVTNPLRPPLSVRDIAGQPCSQPRDHRHAGRVPGGRPRPLDMDEERVYLPALAVPVARKAEWQFPNDHLNALADDLGQVENVITIGWRGAEDNSSNSCSIFCGQERPHTLFARVKKRHEKRGTTFAT